MWFPIVLMSLLGGYKKKSSYDGYDLCSWSIAAETSAPGDEAAAAAVVWRQWPSAALKQAPRGRTTTAPWTAQVRNRVDRMPLSRLTRIKQLFCVCFKACCFPVRIQGGGLNISWRYPPEACASCRLLFVCCVMTIDQSHRAGVLEAPLTTLIVSW